MFYAMPSWTLKMFCLKHEIMESVLWHVNDFSLLVVNVCLTRKECVETPANGKVLPYFALKYYKYISKYVAIRVLIHKL